MHGALRQLVVYATVVEPKKKKGSEGELGLPSTT